MSEINNFKKLQEEQEEQYSHHLLNIQNSLNSNLTSIGTFTKVLDVYISKVVNYFLVLSGGSEKTTKDFDKD